MAARISSYNKNLIQSNGFPTLLEGQAVKVFMNYDKDGCTKAVNVTILPRSPCSDHRRDGDIERGANVIYLADLLSLAFKN